MQNPAGLVNEVNGSQRGAEEGLAGLQGIACSGGLQDG